MEVVHNKITIMIEEKKSFNTIKKLAFFFLPDTKKYFAAYSSFTISRIQT